MTDTAITADELVLPATPVAEYSTTAAELAKLRERFKDAKFNFGTAEGLADAKKARAELVGLRTSLEAKRVELKEPVLTRGRLIDAEAKRITAELLALESPIDAAIKAEEQRKEREKVARQKAEAARIAAAGQRIKDIEEFHTTGLGCRTAERVLILMQKLTAISLDGLDEYTEQAYHAKTSTLKKLEEIHAQKLLEQAEREKREAEAREAKERADRAEAELASFRAAQAAKDAELQAAHEALAARQRELDQQEEAMRKANEPAPVEPDPPAAITPTVAAEPPAQVVDESAIQADPQPFVNADLFGSVAESDIEPEPQEAYTPTALEICNCVAEIHCIPVELAAAWIVAAMDDIRQISTI